MTTTITRFSAYLRTRSIVTARDSALAYDAVVGFCPFDGLYYVLAWEDWAAAPLCGNALPIPPRGGA